MFKHDDIVKICYISSTFFNMEETDLIFSIAKYGYNKIILTTINNSHIFANKHGSHMYSYENNCWLTFLVNNITSTMYFIKIMVIWLTIKTLYKLNIAFLFSIISANQYYLSSY